MNRCTVCRELVSGSASAEHQRMHSRAKNHQRVVRWAKIRRRRGHVVEIMSPRLESGWVEYAVVRQSPPTPGFFSRIWQVIQDVVRMIKSGRAGKKPLPHFG